MEDSPLLKRWASTLRHAAFETSKQQPNYFLPDPTTLISSSDVVSFQAGVGDDILASVLPSLEAARSEIIFVTCFWAKSSSLDRLCRSLCALSDRVVRDGQPRVRVRICLSSLSLFQKLLQTSSLQGRDYPPKEWVKKLGLPPPERLQGLDLQIKSIFVRPFSVMHPKFIVIDREHVWLPSCNVSWEEWFEGCVELQGPIVAQFVRFWDLFWRSPRDISSSGVTAENAETLIHDSVAAAGPAKTSIVFTGLGNSTFSVFLPSQHRINPQFRPLPFLSAAPPPITPLNVFVLQLLADARRAIYVQTPNLTSPPVLTALLSALKRGVNVHIVTCERLMILEQLVTAGTTTVRCVNQLIRRYKRLFKRQSSRSDNYDDLEQQSAPGKLEIEFYQASTKKPGEPVQSHIKLTAVDDEWLVLGSGNMDRASWYTSQELGVAFYNKNVTVRVMDLLDSTLKDRKKIAFPLGS